MPHSDAAPPPREPLPRHTTPTWEMELLISGATVFALTQLPDTLHAALYHYVPQFDRSLAAMALLPYLYGMTATYALITTFVLHLATCGYWVALVGLHSVYPDGVLWDRLRWGINYLTSTRARTPELKALIERADNRASLVFGYGIGFALLAITPLALGAVLALLSGALYEFLGRQFSWAAIWTGSFLLLFGPFGIAVIVDRILGRKLAPDGRFARLLRRIFSGYQTAGFSSFASYPVLLLVSRVGTHRGSMLLSAAMLALIGAVVLQVMLREGDLRLDGYRYIPSADVGAPGTVNPVHYADQRRGQQTLSPQPFIQSEVVPGDYLRLFIPYRPNHDTHALEQHCPQLRDVIEPDTDAMRETQTAAVLACLAKLYEIQLDRQAILAPDLAFGLDPATGQRGVLAMLPIKDLAAGRHELQIARADMDDANDDDANDTSRSHWRIRFWR